MQWLAYRSACTDGRFFKKRDNVIHFNKDIVETTFGFADGTIPFTMGRIILDIQMIEVEVLCKPYRVGNKFLIQKLESVLLGYNDELVFIRSFILFFITTVCALQLITL
jgi:hypothetical protein